MIVETEKVVVRNLGRVEYSATRKSMRDFTLARDDTTADEFWLVEHPPVYTLGQGAADAAVTNGIPVVRSDRGGEITYHGPGQLVVYTLIDLARRRIKVKRFVWLLEQAVIDFLEGRNAGRGERKPGAPGVYVDGAKIAALGIRVARGRAYHGLALNVDMDLSPFTAIDPCGYPDLRVADLKTLGVEVSVDTAGKKLSGILISRLEDA